MSKDQPKEQKFERRDNLLKIQQWAQDKWDTEKPFEVDAGSVGEDKFMVTFPYPYMNGRLHLGHAFSLTKSEFAAGYNRLKGKRTLFPFGFHCTGMPISAAAGKLRNEFKKYGSPLPTLPASAPDFKAVTSSSVKFKFKAPSCTANREIVEYLVKQQLSDSGEFEVCKSIPFVAGKEVEVELTDLQAKTAYKFKVGYKLSDGTFGPDSDESASQVTDEAAVPDPAAGKKKGGKAVKAKVAQKTGGVTFQFTILQGMGIPDEDIVKFEEPLHWLQYFPPYGKEDLKLFGCRIDFRRSFITTDVNKYYDSFIRWQFNKLKAGGYIAFGKRPTIFSITDGQACMDHDRAEGEGVGPQEYVGIKMMIKKLPEKLKSLEGYNVYCIAATLRPETMVGQTNCWILPEGKYGCFKQSDKDVFVCSHRSALNMSHQDIFPATGKPECLLEVTGQDLMGVPMHAPLAPHKRIHMLPLLTIKMDKGTGVVTSVPSDSPDDYAAFLDMQNAKKREFYGVKEEWVMPFVDLVEIIETPTLGRLAAKFMCEKLKIQSQKDKEKLEEAHDIVYKEGFYKGVMTAGPYTGLPVQEAKLNTKADMVKDGDAIVYSEPEKRVVSRSGDDCVVALVDQWYLKYGEQEWRTAVADHLKTFECYNPDTKVEFNRTVSWLKEWACSRSFGLGTRIPWDEQFLIESLSDSTIYMAYYTVAHILQNGVLDGTTVSPSGIKPEDLNDGVWDCIMLEADYPAGCKIAEPLVMKMRKEFQFWYPMDLRVSGRDLIQNHLTMCLYNHAAVWKDQPEMWPKSFYTNGHVMVNAEKMSKSKGNFLTLKQCVEKYSADITRLTCADAGDGIEEANFQEDVANKLILRITTELEWIKETLEDKTFREGPAVHFMDRWFENEMNMLLTETVQFYDKMYFKEAMRTGFFQFQAMRNTYRDAVPEGKMHRGLVMKFIEWQTLLLCPICPHLTEHIWTDLLKKNTSVMSAVLPTNVPPLDPVLHQAGDFLMEAVHSFQVELDKVHNTKKKGSSEAPPKMKHGIIFVATSFPSWQTKVLNILRSKFDPVSKEIPKDVLKTLSQDEELKARGKKVQQFAAVVREDAVKKGVEAFALSSPFDEYEVIADNLPYIQKLLRLDSLRVFTVPDGMKAVGLEESDKSTAAAPGQPSVSYTTEPMVSLDQVPVMDYVGQKDLQAALNEAVNEAIRMRPADPVKFVGRYLLQSGQK